jgi:hypothetical protein
MTAEQYLLGDTVSLHLRLRHLLDVLHVQALELIHRLLDIVDAFCPGMGKHAGHGLLHAIHHLLQDLQRLVGRQVLRDLHGRGSREHTTLQHEAVRVNIETRSPHKYDCDNGLTSA